MGVYSDSDSKKTITFHWGNNTGSKAFCAMDMATGDCVVSFANSVYGPSVFEQVAEPIVGDIKPLFEWLSEWCSFKDATPQSPDSTANLAHLIHSLAKEDSDVEITNPFKLGMWGNCSLTYNSRVGILGSAPLFQNSVISAN